MAQESLKSDLTFLQNYLFETHHDCTCKQDFSGFPNLNNNNNNNKRGRKKKQRNAIHHKPAAAQHSQPARTACSFQARLRSGHSVLADLNLPAHPGDRLPPSPSPPPWPSDGPHCCAHCLCAAGSLQTLLFKIKGIKGISTTADLSLRLSLSALATAILFGLQVIQVCKYRSL